MKIYRYISDLGESAVRNIILWHYFFLFVCGFIFYDDAYQMHFYACLQISTILIYITCLSNLSQGNRILIQGLFEMTVFELVDFFTGANKKIPDEFTTHKKLLIDFIIVAVISIRTYRRYKKNGKIRRHN